MLQFGFTRNRDGVFWGPKIDKRNKRPPLALENLISAPGANSSIYGTNPAGYIWLNFGDQTTSRPSLWYNLQTRQRINGSR